MLKIKFYPSFFRVEIKVNMILVFETPYRVGFKI